VHQATRKWKGHPLLSWGNPPHLTNKWLWSEWALGRISTIVFGNFILQLTSHNALSKFFIHIHQITVINIIHEGESIGVVKNFTCFKGNIMSLKSQTRMQGILIFCLIPHNWSQSSTRTTRKPNTTLLSFLSCVTLLWLLTLTFSHCTSERGWRRHEKHVGHQPI